MGEFQIWSRPHHHLWEFPIATVRAREPRARAIAMLGDLHRWLALRWAWFKPRTVPVIAAALGMLLVLAAADYLAHHDPQARQSDLLIVRVR